MGALPVGDGLRDSAIDVIGIHAQGDVSTGRDSAERLGQPGECQEAQGAVKFDLPLPSEAKAIHTMHAEVGDHFKAPLAKPLARLQ